MTLKTHAGKIEPHAREEQIEPKKGAKNQLTHTKKLIGQN